MTKKIIIKILMSLLVHLITIVAMAGMMLFVVPLLPIFNGTKLGFSDLLSINMEIFVISVVIFFLAACAATLHAAREDTRKDKR